MSAAPNIVVLIMAAGQSRRMGCDKLLLRYDHGQTLLEDRIRTAGDCGLQLFVAVGADQRERQNVIAHSNAKMILCKQSHRGLGHSLSEAIGSLRSLFHDTPDGEPDGVIILLADMPAISSADILAIRNQFRSGHVVRGSISDRTHAQKPGHPVLIPAALFDRLATLDGDQGAQTALGDAPLLLVPLPDNHATLDIDKPKDWQAWIVKFRKQSDDGAT